VVAANVGATQFRANVGTAMLTSDDADVGSERRSSLRRPCSIFDFLSRSQ
jgi:hypothetical protein